MTAVCDFPNKESYILGLVIPEKKKTRRGPSAELSVITGDRNAHFEGSVEHRSLYLHVGDTRGGKAWPGPHWDSSPGGKAVQVHGKWEEQPWRRVPHSQGGGSTWRAERRDGPQRGGSWGRATGMAGAAARPGFWSTPYTHPQNISLKTLP